jgi:hypothetical protein
MSTETVISMRELEAESAELLPSRETLSCGRPPCHPSPCGGGFLAVDVNVNVAVIVGW